MAECCQGCRCHPRALHAAQGKVLPLTETRPSNLADNRRLVTLTFGLRPCNRELGEHEMHRLTRRGAKDEAGSSEPLAECSPCSQE